MLHRLRKFAAAIWLTRRYKAVIEATGSRCSAKHFAFRVSPVPPRRRSKNAILQKFTGLQYVKRPHFEKKPLPKSVQTPASILALRGRHRMYQRTRCRLHYLPLLQTL